MVQGPAIPRDTLTLGRLVEAKRNPAAGEAGALLQRRICDLDFRWYLVERVMLGFVPQPNLRKSDI